MKAVQSKTNDPGIVRRRAEVQTFDADEVRTAVASLGRQLVSMVESVCAQLHSLRAACQSSSASAAQLERIGRMQRGLDRLRAAIGHLYAESEAHLREADIVQVDLSLTMQELMKEQAAEIEARGVTIGIGKLPTVPADAALMRRVLRNILVHAAEHAAADAPRVGIVASAGGDAWTIAVHDNGPGLGGRDPDSLFETSRTGAHAVSTRSALGLALAAHDVKRLGGSIGAFDHPDGGLVIWMRLGMAPLAAAETETVAHAAPEAAAASASEVAEAAEAAAPRHEPPVPASASVPATSTPQGQEPPAVKPQAFTLPNRPLGHGNGLGWPVPEPDRQAEQTLRGWGAHQSEPSTAEPPSIGESGPALTPPPAALEREPPKAHRESEVEIDATIPQRPPAERREAHIEEQTARPDLTPDEDRRWSKPRRRANRSSATTSAR